MKRGVYTVYQILNRRKVNTILPKRKLDAHKGDMGKILLLCGSIGYTGAAEMAALGALRSGAGLVYLGVPTSIYEIMATKLSVPVVFPLVDHDGMLCDDALQTIGAHLNRADAVLIGPGLGISVGTEHVVKNVLESFNGPVVLDADGITVMSKHKNILRERTGTTVLTPHEGEFSRFTGERILDRKRDAEKLADELGCVVVLKGHKTVITDGVETYINMTGNPGMAVGGSGDVLAGIITSLIGQGISPLTAAACGAWLHGAAGDICAREIGQYGMIPKDLLHVLPRLMK